MTNTEQDIAQNRAQDKGLSISALSPFPFIPGGKMEMLSFIQAPGMITTTTDFLQGYEIKNYLGTTTAEVVYGTNALRDFMAGLRDVFGGRTASYEKVFEKGQKEALKELEDRAARMGADAVIGIQLNTDSINIDSEGVLFLITATGTAVTLK